jgi:UPF0042 nucleotide-binding protein
VTHRQAPTPALTLPEEIPLSQPERRLCVISFGFLHAEPPIEADMIIDLRPLRDPHIDPALRELTARDQVVVDTVLRTPGIPAHITGAAFHAHVELTEGFDVTIAVGCSGGRHRAPVVAEQVAAAVREYGWPVDLVHRDLDKPVVNR